MGKSQFIGSVYQRKDGRFCCEVQHRDGRRRYFYGATEAAAKRKGKAFLEEAARYDGGAVVKTELGEFMCNWLENDLAISLKPKSYEAKRYAIDKLIVPYLGSYQLGAVRRPDIQGLITELSKQYAWWTVKKAYDALRQCFKSAVADRYISFDPTVGVKMPKKNTENCKPIRWFTEEELVRILTVASETYPTGTPVTRLGYAFHLLAYTGLRIGEAIALTWEDVDFNARTIRVTKNAVRTINPDRYSKKKTLMVVQDSPKTQSGIRVIPMGKKAEFALRKLYDINGCHETVLATESGRMADRGNLTRAFSGIQKRAGIEPPGTLHSLRHTFATRLIERGVDVKVVSTLLGHADVSTTYNTYIHVLQKQKVRAIEQLDEI